METFNAQKAKEIASKNNNELQEILDSIKVAAEKSEFVLHVYKNLNSRTIMEIKNRGFSVSIYPSIAIQKEEIYYSIRWE